LFVNFSPHATIFVHGTCYVLILFMELLRADFCSKNFLHVDFFSWYLDTDFLIIKLILFTEHIACWFLFVELVAYWFLLVKLVAYWFFSLWNSLTDFSPRKNDFVLGTCYVLIFLFVCGTWCMLTFYCDTCWFFREIVHWFVSTWNWFCSWDLLRRDFCSWNLLRAVFRSWKSARSKFREQDQFHEEKNHVQVSQRENSTYNKFREQKSGRSKFYQQKWVSRGEKSMYKFRKKKNQHATDFMNRN